MESLDTPYSTKQLCGVVEVFGTESSTCTASSLFGRVGVGQCEMPGMVGHSRVMEEVQGGGEQGGNEDDPASCGCCRC